MINRNPPAGTQVLVRDNEDGPFQTGYLYCFQTMGASKEEFPVVVMHYNCMPMICMGNCEIRKILNEMTPKDQWNYLSLHYKRE